MKVSLAVAVVAVAMLSLVSGCGDSNEMGVDVDDPTLGEPIDRVGRVLDPMGYPRIDAEIEEEVGAICCEEVIEPNPEWMECAFVEVPLDACTFSQGYWKTHPEAWPQGFTFEVDGDSYDQAYLLDLMAGVYGNDASVVLMKQLVAALLNGGLETEHIASTVEAALGWLAANSDGQLPFPGISEEAVMEATALAGALAQYNLGHACVPHCGTGGVLYDGAEPYSP